MISTRSVELVIDTVVCLTLAKWETVSGQFGGNLTRKSLFQLLMHHFRSQRSSWRSVLFIIVTANVFPHDIPEHIGMYFSLAWFSGYLGAILVSPFPLA